MAERLRGDNLFQVTLHSGVWTRHILPESTAPLETVDLFDPAAPPELLARHAVVGVYANADTEREFAAFLTTNRVTVTVLGAVGFVTSLAVLLTIFPEVWIGQVLLSSGGVALVLSILNYFFCVRGANIRRNGVLHEAFATLMLLSAVTLPLTHYPALIYYRATFGGDGGDAIIPHYTVALTQVPLTFLAVRPWFVAPPFALYVVVLQISWMAHTEAATYLQHRLTMLVFGTMAFGVIVCHFATDRWTRRRFEHWVHLRRSATELNARREVVHRTLKNLLPESVMENIRANRPMVESAEQCSVTAMRVADFGRWAWDVAPNSIVACLSSLVMLSDDVLGQFNVDRLRVVGDLYVVSSGLRQARAVTESAINCVRFGLRQSRRLQLVSAVLQISPLSMQVGVGSGWCYAGFVGVRSLWYEGFGEALDVALALMRVCPPSKVVVCSSTRDSCGRRMAFEDEPLRTCDIEGFTASVAARTTSEAVAPQDAVPLALPGVPEAGAPAEGIHVPRRDERALSGVRVGWRTPVADMANLRSRVALDTDADEDAAADSDSGSAGVDRSRIDYLSLCARASATTGEAALLRFAHGDVSDDEEDDGGEVADSPSGDGTSAAGEHSRLFGDEELNRLVAQLKEPRPWWQLRFPNAVLEAQFAAYRARCDRQDGTLATLFGLAFSVVALIVLLVEWDHHPASYGLTSGAVSVLVARLVARSLLRKRLAPWESLASFGAYFLLLGGGIAAARPGTLLIASCDYFLFFQAPLSLLWCRRVSWVGVMLLVVAQSAATMAIEYRTRVHPSSLFYFIGPVLTAALSYASFSHERHTSDHFGTYALARATQRAAHTELLVHRGMLQLVCPSFAVSAVEKRNRDSLMCVVCRSPDLCTLTLRFESAAAFAAAANAAARGAASSCALPSRRAPPSGGPEALLRAMERRFSVVDDALAAVQLSADGSARRETRCFRLRAYGDEALLAGPMRAPSQASSGDGAGSAAAQGLTFEDSAQAALDLAAVAAAVMRRAPRCAAVLACGEGLVAIFGNAPPIVDVCGSATRTAAGLMDAVPSGVGRTLYVTDAVLRMLATCHRSFPTATSPSPSLLFPSSLEMAAPSFERRDRQRWRLRSCGVVYVTLFVPTATSGSKDNAGVASPLLELVEASAEDSPARSVFPG